LVQDCAVGSKKPSAHGLVTLPLAILVLREKVYRAQPAGAKEQADANTLAALIAGAVRLWECAEDPAVPPRLVRHDPRKGRFLNDGRELHFFDGRPVKRRLAVQADELAGVIAKLTQGAAGNGFPLGPGER
jgi:hypothetical protein